MDKPSEALKGLVLTVLNEIHFYLDEVILFLPDRADESRILKLTDEYIGNHTADTLQLVAKFLRSRDIKFMSDLDYQEIVHPDIDDLEKLIDDSKQSYDSVERATLEGAPNFLKLQVQKLIADLSNTGTTDTQIIFNIKKEVIYISDRVISLDPKSLEGCLLRNLVVSGEKFYWTDIMADYSNDPDFEDITTEAQKETAKKQLGDASIRLNKKIHTVLPKTKKLITRKNNNYYLTEKVTISD